MTGSGRGDTGRPAVRWRTEGAINQITNAFGALVLLQFATVALYEAGVLAGPVAAVAGIVAQLGKLHLSNVPALLIWAAARILFPISFRDRVLVTANWTYAYATHRRTNRLIRAKGCSQVVSWTA